MEESLAEALPRQINRVLAKRDRWIQMSAEMPAMAIGMKPAINLMQIEIAQAINAAANGDVAEMMRAHEALAAYSDDD